jgi:hypothetical protein
MVRLIHLPEHFQGHRVITWTERLDAARAIRKDFDGVVHDLMGEAPRIFNEPITRDEASLSRRSK